MNTKKIVSTVVFILFCASIFLTVGNVNQYFDLASLVVVVVIGLLYAIGASGAGTYVQKFGDGAVRAGWFGSIIGIIAIFGSDGFGEANMQAIGAALAVCSLTVLYGYFFKLCSIFLD
tara:strand:- start:204 stop:557 length:354 start_codon:yes stop_codon:yes gene_type:complete